MLIVIISDCNYSPIDSSSMRNLMGFVRINWCRQA